jgi:hypothetical protein
MIITEKLSHVIGVPIILTCNFVIHYRAQTRDILILTPIDFTNNFNMVKKTR